MLAALQAAWPRPLDAMAELENLLFRKRSGELFELPAYRDVLILYSVARDLHRQLDQPAHDVDVLLPLARRRALRRAVDLRQPGLQLPRRRCRGPARPRRWTWT